MKRVGVDVGGTFTDLIYVDDEAGVILVHKLPTTPDDPSQGTIQGVKELADEAGAEPSALDQVFRALGRFRNVPEVRVVKHFHDHPAYVRALSDLVQEHWRPRGRPERIVITFHGLPRYTLDRGDPMPNAAVASLDGRHVARRVRGTTR